MSPLQKKSCRISYSGDRKGRRTLVSYCKARTFIFLLDKSSATNIVSNTNTPGPVETTFSFENPRSPFSDGTLQALGAQLLSDSFNSPIGFIQGEKIQTIKIFEVVFFSVYNFSTMKYFHIHNPKQQY